MFTKCCHDASPRGFRATAARIFTHRFAQTAGCHSLPMPALYACTDIAVNRLATETYLHFVQSTCMCTFLSSLLDILYYFAVEVAALLHISSR